MIVPRATAAPDVALGPPPTLRLSTIALFADLDGTLTPLAPTPDAVKPDAERRRLLDALSEALSGRLAIVSGRSLEDLDRVLEHRVAAIAAVHGLVRRTAAGRVIRAAEDRRMGEAEQAFLAFAKADPSLLVEDKQSAVALHYRRAPGAGDACRDLAHRLAGPLRLVVQEGDMVVELRMRGPDKGGAVEAFMAEPPFAGFTPVFVGDDFTDEHGFRAASALGGYGVVVGSRRPTAASFALADVAAAHGWLNDALEATW